MLALFLGLAPLLPDDPPVAPPPRPAIDPALADWTPRPATGKAEPWERATDTDWVDPRFRVMNTGPALNCTMEFPLGKGKQRVHKATAVKLGDGGVVFDRSTMRMTAAWTGGYLNHSDRRFGLLNTPTPNGAMNFAATPGPCWADANGKWDAKPPFTAPLAEEWVRYKGHVLAGDRVVFVYTVHGRGVKEFHRFDGTDLITTYEVSDGQTPLLLRRGSEVVRIGAGSRTVVFRGDNPSRDEAGVSDVWSGQNAKRWAEPIVTRLVRGDEAGPFVVDTLTIPYQNPHKALFFCTGLDFLPDGRVAVCTCHGDVWIVTVDEQAGTCSWLRHATGLYHPLGLKVVDGKVVVLERGQLSRLHDLNNDGEADVYECVTNDWHTGGGEHSYDTCLETDPAGNFYFFKTGDTDLASGGCLMRAAKDGSKVEVFATGFRHPIGLGMSPSGIVTGADQEGNWMPATRIDQYTRGGFYGDMRAHHRPEPPKTFDPPICWVPREVDNSAGGQVWVPANTFGPLAGLPLHFSYGRCRPFVLLRQELADGRVQGGVAGLDVQFLSGVCRGRFAPDGHLYVCGLNGWQTAAKADGCLQRVRWTGKPLDVPVKMAVAGNAVRLTFCRPLDPRTATDPANYRAAWWNYRWSGEYGSDRWKVSSPTEKGQDDVPVKAVRLLDDGRTVAVEFDRLVPVMQMQVGYNVTAADARKVVGSVFLTIHDPK